MRVSKDNARHYNWGNSCDGWVLCSSHDLMIIQERMPPGAVEHRHQHQVARQFFYVLAGELVMELDGIRHTIPAMSGIEVPPGINHQARNDSDADVHFLVASSPTTRGDRVDV
ncbi:MAG: cupin domain-containing protein [Sphingomonadaceae bacterium]|nr:cupin domain-containing protein [Sphingomonadaceae bacterium]